MKMVGWAEKYRPKRFDDFVGNADNVEIFRNFARSKHFSSMLLEGPPGVGKTSIIKVLLNEAFGDRADWIEMNASDDVGIDVVRGDIKRYLSTASTKGAPVKVLILDEADYISSAKAQGALRRIMEENEDNCKVMFICNDGSKIIEPLWDRCAPFYFESIENSEILRGLKRILRKEDRLDAIGKKSLRAIVHEARGSMRRAINRLESVVAPLPRGERISYDVVSAITRSYPEERAELLLKIAREEGFVRALRFIEKDGGRVSPRIFFKVVAEKLFDKKFPKKDKRIIARALGPYAFIDEKFSIYAFLERFSERA